MKEKKVSRVASSILVKMQEGGKSWFTTNQVYVAFPTMSSSTIRTHLQRMCEYGLIFHVKNETYWIIPYEMDAETYMPSWHLLAEPLVGQPYYIGYYSALQLHGLITQPALAEQVVIDRKMNNYLTTVREVPFRFIKHNETHFFGYKKIWIDDYNRVYASDLEKTFIDCLFMPHRAGGVIEIAKALYMAKNKLDFERLLLYAQQMNSKSVVKRLGYLLELMDIENPIIERLHTLRTASLTPLDTEVPHQGKASTKWNIIQNVDVQTIKNSILS